MKELIIFLVIVSIPLAIGLYLVIKPGLLKRRRARLRRRPPPQGVEEILSRNVGLYALLPDDLREQLHGHMNVFLDEKQFLGLGGQEITADVAVTIAGTACMLLLNREPSYFPGFSSILVYPNVYEAEHVDYDGVVETRKRSRRAGESWHRGPIVLAWSSVSQGAANAGDGYNVVLHEFAHQLDSEDGGADGASHAAL